MEEKLLTSAIRELQRGQINQCTMLVELCAVGRVWQRDSYLPITFYTSDAPPSGALAYPQGGNLVLRQLRLLEVCKYHIGVDVRRFVDAPPFAGSSTAVR
jgi:hypothetical protein